MLYLDIYRKSPWLIFSCKLYVEFTGLRSTTSPRQVHRNKADFVHSRWTPVKKTMAGKLIYGRVLGERFLQERGKLADMRTDMVLYTFDTERKCYRF